MHGQRWSGTLLALFAAVGIATAAADSAQDVRTELVVRANSPGPRVNPSMYGIFFEEINHGGDGGLYAELVRNRSFEDGPTPDGWTLVKRQDARASMALDTFQPLNLSQGNALRLRVDAAGLGEAGVANEGFWGVPVRKGASYQLSFFARRGDKSAATFYAALEGADDKSYAREKIVVAGDGWKRVAVTLRSTADDPAARLVLTTSTPGTTWLDVVSLFPSETWKGRPNGLRPDLAEHVRGMSPAFARFPGGCYCEGDRLVNAFRWKDSLGPIHQRPGHPSLWGYRSTDGLGYHEYLQWCEDLRAEPMFVVNCGMAHLDIAPLSHLGEWIQDALDAVEYANGPVSSKWGALRAKNGHPKPFHLKYLEIGNENGWGNTLAAYEERYARFYDALKARYPDLILIATTPVKSRPMDLQDDHYYNSPDWFWANTGLYDGRGRQLAPVYVGEYAVTQNCGEGNLRAALAEAAFMTGLERNADVVRLTSYAPLFVNVRDRKWNPDAIVFDTHRSFGTPSYHVQRLFAENRPDVVLPVDLAEPQPPLARGGIGLGTWLTQSEFKDVRVTQNSKSFYASDFTNGAPGWTPIGGEWKAVDGAYRQTAPGENRFTLLPGHARDEADYSLTLKARKLGGSEGFLIMFRSRDMKNFYWWNLGGWLNTEHGIEKGVDGSKLPVGPRVPGKIETGRWYDIHIELEGTRIRCYLDGKLIHDVRDRGVPTFAAVAGRVEKSGDVILKVVNGAETPRRTTVKLPSVSGLKPTAQATILTSADMADENSLERPNRVSPTTTMVSGIGSEFTHTFPPRSLTILRLKTR